MRLYIASLSDYNAGTLHGVWVDMHLDIDEIWAKVNTMLAASPSAAKYGDIAEEWAIHDHDEAGGLDVNEYADLERLHEIAELMNEHTPEAVAGYLNNNSTAELHAFGEAYKGKWESLREYLLQWMDDVDFLNLSNIRHALQDYNRSQYPSTDWSAIIAKIEHNIDWNSLCNELVSDFYTYPDPEGGVHVYESR